MSLSFIKRGLFLSTLQILLQILTKDDTVKEQNLIHSLNEKTTSRLSDMLWRELVIGRFSKSSLPPSHSVSISPVSHLCSTRALLWFFLPQALHEAKCTAFSGLHSGTIFVSVGRVFVTLSLVTIWHPLHANSHWKFNWNRGSAHKSIASRSGSANTGVSLWPEGTGREESASQPRMREALFLLYSKA